ISGVGSMIFMIHSNQLGILLKIGVAQSPEAASLAAAVASVAPDVAVCSHSNGIFTESETIHESSPSPLNSNGTFDQLDVAFSQVPSPHNFVAPSTIQNPPTKIRSGMLHNTFPYRLTRFRNTFRLSFEWKNSSNI